MILVEDPPHLGYVHVVRGLLGPRDVEDPVDVGADDGVLRRADLHLPQALELLARDLVRLARQIGLGDALLEDVEVALIALLLAELFLDRLELLAQDVLALVLAHLLLDLGVDALAHLEDLELPREQPEHLADAVLRVDRLEELGLLVDGRVEVRGDEIGELPRLLDRVDERAGLARQLGHELDDLLRNVAQAHRQRLALDVLRGRLLELRDARLHVRIGARHVLHAHADEPLEDEAVVAGAVLQRLEDAGRHADRVEVVLVRIVGRGVALREDRDDRLREVVDVLDQRDRLLATDVEGGDRTRKQDGVPDREDRELVAEAQILIGELARLLVVVCHFSLRFSGVPGTKIARGNIVRRFSRRKAGTPVAR